MIEIGKDAIVYLLCPPAYASGGPELMYQLANKLETYGINAFMYYHPKHDDPVHENYKVYGTKAADTIVNDRKNLIIVPEALASKFNTLEGFNDIRKCIWWLSIDNFFKKLYKRTIPRNIAKIPVLADLKIPEKRFFASEVIEKKYDYHLAQSHYAIEFLRKKKINAEYLSDYLSITFLARADEVQTAKKENLVLYNPKKGIKFTEKIIAKAPDLTWVPIQNMTPTQVADLLARSKVYIDFGNHPGKDRFPREAAIMKCCIITGKQGAAKYDEDVTIPSRYKIPDSTANIDKIIALVKSCLQDFEQHSKDFDAYRQIIRGDEQRFIDDIKRVFVKSDK
ncbi:MAG: hypothetical protein JWQ28_1029 [Pedobacter sp.]|nr:hypothetical protein [Pedobacter sp.]